MTRPDEEGFYRSDQSTLEESQYKPAHAPGWVVLAVVCPLIFALGFAAGVLLSIAILG